MTFLSVLLSVMMTFTVETKSTVSMQGSWPYDIGVDYACTYQKGTVRAGDTATLRLSGLENIMLEQVRVYLRSNKSAGAGQLTMLADNSMLYETSGTYHDWFGEYNNATFQPIGWTGEKKLQDGTLRIQLIGTTNSLYIERYEILYSQPVAEAHTVTLHAGDDIRTLTETAPGSGIVLPTCEQRNEWYFLGWSETDIPNPSTDKPTCYMPGETYYPRRNETLWAVWSDVEPPTETPTVQPESGYYLLHIQDQLLSGIVENGYINLLPYTNYYYEDQIYYLDFSSTDSTLTIHNYTYNKYIGYDYQHTQLANNNSVWRYRLMPDSTWLIYAAQEGEYYWALFYNTLTNYAWLHRYTLGENLSDLWTLYRVPDPAVQARYWSHPWHTAVESVPATKIDYTIPFGPYRLHIHDGHKTLQL